MLTLQIKSLDKTVLKLYLMYINTVLNKLKLKYKIIRLPTKSKKISVLKSPHVNKKAFEQFEFKVYKSIIQINLTILPGFFKNILINKPRSISLKIKRIV